MVSLVSLVIPIFGSAMLVFLASFIIHMVLPFHRNDLRKLSREDEVMAALRQFDIAPGDYAVPCAGSPEGLKSPDFIEKVRKGPIVLMTIARGGSLAMGKNLLLWFLYSVLVSFFAAYITSRALPPSTPYPAVFRFIGTSAFMGYSLALLQNSIWHRRNWGTTLKSMFDGLVYGLLTAGMFGWLWPR